MKFVYEYRTSDNVRHSGVVAASNRDAAFAVLKAQGIRPGVLRDAPGFFNKLFGKGKRWIAIGVLAVLCLALAVVAERGLRVLPHAAALADSLDGRTRRQIIGDAAVIEKGVRTGWSDMFTLEGDRFLASFAVPGVPPAVRATTEGKIKEALDDSSAEGRQDREGISMEARQIFAIVAGMKDELRRFIADGGTIPQYGRRLVQRQEQEIGYYSRAKVEVETAAKAGKKGDELERLLEQRNDSLRAMGIRLVSMPEKVDE